MRSARPSAILAVGVADSMALARRWEGGREDSRGPPARLKFGTTVIAFIEDPDGYKIELIQRR